MKHDRGWTWPPWRLASASSSSLSSSLSESPSFVVMLWFNGVLNATPSSILGRLRHYDVCLPWIVERISGFDSPCTTQCSRPSTGHISIDVVKVIDDLLSSYPFSCHCKHEKRKRHKRASTQKESVNRCIIILLKAPCSAPNYLYRFCTKYAKDVVEPPNDC